MTDTPFPLWSDEWLQMQRKYWTDWLEMSRKNWNNFPVFNATSHPWQQAMQQYWKAATMETPAPAAQDFFNRLLDQGKHFFTLSDSLIQGLQMEAAGKLGQNWQQTIQNALGALQQSFNSSTTGLNEAMHRMMAFWEVPMDTWQGMVSTFSGLPGNPLQPFHTQGLDPFRHSLDRGVRRFLSTPGLGYTREQQEQYQKAAQLWLDYLQILQDYNRAFARMGNAATERLQEKLVRMGDEGQQINSLKELYGQWVDCCEEAYANYVSDEEYSQLYGRLINATMALKRHTSIMLDEFLGALNLPTREEIDTVQQRLHEARQETKRLRAELEELRQQIADRPASSAPAAESEASAAAPKRATRRASPRKKPATSSSG